MAALRWHRQGDIKAKLSEVAYMKKMNIKSNSSHFTTEYVLCGMTGFLLLTTIISGIVLSSSTTHADTTTTRSSAVSVTVNNACTMKGGSDGTATGNSVYSATVDPGTTKEITGSKLTTVCNDSNGYSIYAIGYSGDNYTTNNTKMIGSGSIGNIDTGTTTGGDNSSWAMKLAAVSGVTAPTILNDFNNYHVVPATYTQIAKYTSATGTSTSAGAQVQTKYQVYISSAQAAGTYTGKVKYTMVHPNGGAAPTTPLTLDAIVASGTTHYMQESIDCGNSTVGTVVTLTDNRDNQTYKVAKAKDGQCWMIENLKLGKTIDTEGESLTLTAADSNTNGNYTLQYSDIPTDGKFHAYTIDGIQYQNNSNEFICRTDWDSCYYNWYTATAGTGTTYVTSGNVENSICPTGWTLPTSGNSGQFQALYNQYPSAALMEVDNPTTTMNNSAGKIPGFLLSGHYETRGASGLGDGGLYWSRTAHSAQYAYYLSMNTSIVYLGNVNYKYFGVAVRCVAGQ